MKRGLALTNASSHMSQESSGSTSPVPVAVRALTMPLLSPIWIGRLVVKNQVLLLELPGRRRWLLRRGTHATSLTGGPTSISVRTSNARKRQQEQQHESYSATSKRPRVLARNSNDGGPCISPVSDNGLSSAGDNSGRRPPANCDDTGATPMSPESQDDDQGMSYFF